MALTDPQDPGAVPKVAYWQWTRAASVSHLQRLRGWLIEAKEWLSFLEGDTSVQGRRTKMKTCKDRIMLCKMCIKNLKVLKANAADDNDNDDDEETEGSKEEAEELEDVELTEENWEKYL